MSQIRGIAIRRQPRIAMQSIESAEISVHAGIIGDYRGSLKGRQLSLLSEADWLETCTEVGAEGLPWTTRRANLLIDEVSFDDSWVGRRLRIGAVELLVTCETAPCSLMDAQQAGLTAALRSDWRGGVCCDVLQPGHIALGDQVEVDWRN